MDMYTSSVFDLTKACQAKFNECTSYSCLQEHEWADNQRADFNLWATAVGATTDLDTRFQSQPDRLTGLKGVLMMMNNSLGKCMHGAKSKSPVGEGIKAVESSFENLMLLAAPLSRGSRIEHAGRLCEEEDHGGHEAFLRSFFPRGSPANEESTAELNSTSTEEHVGQQAGGLSTAQSRLLEIGLRRKSRFLQQHSRGREESRPVPQGAMAAVPCYPKPPKIEAGSTTFECPYCRETLPAEVAANAASWKYASPWLLLS